MRLLAAFLCVLLLGAVPGIAQEEELPETESAGQSSFDSQPFLEAMLQLRRTALECDGIVQGNPASRTAAIEDFFDALNYEVPDLLNETTRDSLEMIVRSQAASICQERLNATYDTYQSRAEEYVENKPEAWPAPPRVTRTNWCATETCTDLS